MKRIILFDGECHFCNWSVQFIISRDPTAKFKFAHLQSDVAKRVLCEDFQNKSTVVLIENGKVYTKSTAALLICKQLTIFWRLLYIFVIIPRPIRDFFYQIIAKNRYRWFGKKTSCMIPSPEIQKRFLK